MMLRLITLLVVRRASFYYQVVWLAWCMLRCVHSSSVVVSYTKWMGAQKDTAGVSIDPGGVLDLGKIQISKLPWLCTLYPIVLCLVLEKHLPAGLVSAGAG